MQLYPCPRSLSQQNAWPGWQRGASGSLHSLQREGRSRSHTNDLMGSPVVPAYLWTQHRPWNSFLLQLTAALFCCFVSCCQNRQLEKHTHLQQNLSPQSAECETVTQEKDKTMQLSQTERERCLVQKRLSNTNNTLDLCRKAMSSLQDLKKSATAQFCRSQNSRHSPHLMDVNTLAMSCWWEQKLFLPPLALESTELFAKSSVGSLSEEKHRTCSEGIHLNTDSWHQVGGHLHRNVSKSQGGLKAVPIPALMAHLPPRNQQAMARIAGAITSSSIPSHSWYLLGNKIHSCQ